MAELEKAWGYQGDNLNLPVRDVAAAVPFYEAMGFTVVSRGDAQHRDGSRWNVFFVVAPDGLCYWFGEPQSAPPG